MEVTDPDYVAITDYLSSVCFAEIDWYTERDEYMVGLYADCTQYKIFENCPGAGQKHMCVFSRVEQRVPPPGEKVIHG